MQITYRELRDCYMLAREADRLREQIIRLRARVEGAGMSADGTTGSGAAGDPVGNAVAEMAQLKERWNEKITKYLALAVRVDEAIAEIQDPTLRMLLSMRYIDNMAWGEIAEVMSYSESWLVKLHGRALKALLKEDA